MNDYETMNEIRKTPTPQRYEFESRFTPKPYILITLKKTRSLNFIKILHIMTNLNSLQSAGKFGNHYTGYILVEKDLGLLR